MDSVSYQQVFERMASLAGLDPLNVDTLTWEQWRNLADFRLGQWLWLAAEWPELREDAEVALVDDTDAEGVTVRRRAAVPDAAGAVLAVNEERPEDTRGRGVRYRLIEVAGARQVSLMAGATTRDSVWLTYRLKQPRLAGAVYDGERAYAAGAQVYWEDDFYDCLVAAGVNENPGAYPAKWRKVEIPARFREALARGVIADWPNSEDDRMEGKAEEALVRLILDLENQEQQGGQMQVAVNQ